MVDWQGLLKWSLKYQDKDYGKTDFKPMDEENKQWLTQALEEYSFNEIKQMKESLEFLNIQIQLEDEILQEKEIEILNHLELLLDLVEGLNRANDFALLDGIRTILQIILKPVGILNQPKIIACELLQSCSQNNADVQSHSIEIGAFNIMNQILMETNIQIKEYLFSALSTIVRGEFLEGKRNFIDIQGIEFIFNIINDKKSSHKMIQKAFIFLKDLLYYDEKMHMMFSNLTPFMNTGGKNQKIHMSKYQKQNNPLFTDEKELKNYNNCPEELKKYKDIVKKSIQIQELFKFWDQILDNTQNSYIELRTAYFYNINEIVLYKYKEIELNQLKQYENQLQNHLKNIEKNNQKFGGVNDYELKLANILNLTIQSLIYKQKGDQ